MGTSSSKLSRLSSRAGACSKAAESILSASKAFQVSNDFVKVLGESRSVPSRSVGFFGFGVRVGGESLDFALQTKEGRHREEPTPKFCTYPELILNASEAMKS